MKKESALSSLLQSSGNVVTTLGTYIMFASVVLLPLIILPVGENLLVDSKAIFLMLTAFAVFSVWAISTFMRKTLQLTLSPFFFPLILLLVSVLVSSFYHQTVPMNQLLGFGGVYLSFVIIALFGPSILPKNAHKFFLPMLYLPGILLALGAIAELVGMGPSKLLNILLPFGFPSSPMFSLSGSPLTAAEFLFMVLGGTLAALLFKKGHAKQKPFLVLVVVAAVVGIAINIQVLSQQNIAPFLTPFGVSWSIATDLLKSFPMALLGAGPDNFSQAYLVLKPAWINITTSWDITYTQASNLYLSVFVTLGAVGLAAWIWLSFQILKRFKSASADAKPIAAVVLMGLILQLFLPPNAVILGVLALAMAFWVLAEKKTLKDIQMHTFTVQITESDTDVQKVPKNSHFLVYLTTVVCVLLIGVTGWWLGRYILGQAYAFSSLVAGTRGDAIGVYTNQQKAILAYQYSPSFRRSYSNVNMLIALNLSQKPNLTDQEKQQALALVQQAIDEGKAATVIQPNFSMNWLNLARVYSNLIGTADGADSWAVSAYSQAITTAPTDPVLHLEVGGLLYRLNQPQQAVQIFEKAVSLKPDWPNAYYNLANAYKLNKEPEKALQAYQQTVTLLQNSPDVQKQVQAEMNQLQKELSQPQAKNGVTPPVAKKESTASSSALLSPTANQEQTVSPAAKDALKNVNLNETQTNQ